MFAHVHTAFSGGSIRPLEQVFKDAGAPGLNEICITDHVDRGMKADRDICMTIFCG